MTTEECAICGNSVPFATTTHVLVNPKHEEEIADHYICRPCYDEHLEGLFAAMEEDVAILREEDEGGDEKVDAGATEGDGESEDEATTGDEAATDGDAEPVDQS